MIRTAIPFGYLFIALFLIVILVSGICLVIWGWFCLVIWGWFSRSRTAQWLGVGIAGSVVSLIVYNVAIEASLEWNPIISSDAEIIGTWTGRSQTIILSLNNTFSYSTPTENTGGTWTRDDWSLHLKGGYSGTMRFVRFLEHYRLMTNPPIDPDMWDGNIGLKKTHN